MISIWYLVDHMQLILHISQLLKHQVLLPDEKVVLSTTVCVYILIDHAPLL